MAEVPIHAAVDLTNCDREPIHIPGSIQAHGWLIETAPKLDTVSRCSANATELLGRPVQAGDTLDDTLGRTAVHDIRNALFRATDPARPGLILGLTLAGGRAFDVAVHQYQDSTILEFEPSMASAQTPMEISRFLVSRITKVTEEQKLMDGGARILRGAFAYDRVMIYQFDADGAGQVVSESRRPDLETFFGLHFPASDIPQQARLLYLKNTIRVISDSGGARVALQPELGAGGKPLDLSFAHLRSVSPIHCEYLRNMGVAASMSISIIVGGKLWGLVACHHYVPKALSMSQRVAAEMFGEFFSLHLESLQHQRKLESATKARNALDTMLRNAAAYTDIGMLLRENIQAFAALMPCDGIGIWLNGAWMSHGAVPPTKAIPALVAMIKLHARSQGGRGDIWSTHTLSEALAGAEQYRADAAGVLAIPLSHAPRDYLLFFRREVVQTVAWAGNPDKSYDVGAHGDRLTPRKSFALWKQEVERQSNPWTAVDHDIAAAAKTTLVEVVLRHNEVLADERSKGELRQKMLNEELNHRVKNILSLIKSLVSHPVDADRSLEDYGNTLTGRIQALAFAHDQVTRGDGGGSLLDLLNAELSPYRGANAIITLEGPTLTLDARAYSVMALVLHELVTNAAKYGALSVSAAHLSVRWQYSPELGCEIDWQENGGPTVVEPVRKGFGSVLVARSVRFDLGGESSVAFSPTGVTAHFVIPPRFVRHSTPHTDQAAEQAMRAAPDMQHLAGLTVLLLEDQLLIAIDVEQMLAAEGVARVESTATCAEALRELEKFAPDVAVLDVNLGAENSLPVAQELLSRRIPFIFATGYGDSTMIPKALAAVPVVRKPYDGKSLATAIVKVIRG